MLGILGWRDFKKDPGHVLCESRFYRDITSRRIGPFFPQAVECAVVR